MIKDIMNEIKEMNDRDKERYLDDLAYDIKKEKERLENKRMYGEEE